MNKKSGTHWPSYLLKAVEKSVEALPSDEEIKESVEAIDSLMLFFQNLKTQLTQQPTNEVRHDVIRAITMLGNFLSSYNSKVLFASRQTTSISKVPSQSTAQLLEELESLPLDEIQSRLLEKSRYSVKDLRLLARYLNIGVDRNMRRDDLADAIFKRGFANPRGYNAIGGDAAKRITDKARLSGSVKAGPSADDDSVNESLTPTSFHGKTR